MPGTLTLVGTPIGNLSDLSPRALEALQTCDFIAAEDTRVTLKLLNHFGIVKPLISYFEHNKRERGQVICDRLLRGERGVLVTDAGMPAISDPGEELVAQCHEQGIPVGVVPGPTAMATALAVSGLPTGRFTFEGFLSVNKRTRREHLASLVQETRTMVFYEAPHKLAGTLSDLYETLGDRPLALVRELTKIHEEIIRTTLGEAVTRYGAEGEAPRGEFVVIVGGAAPVQRAPATPEEALDIARQYVAQGVSPSEAARRAAADTGCRKGEIYRLLTRGE
ncbi:MAG: 16S rRNA (cytidine(1402)-2'-O)-methyltransferase [Ruminococcaceae bacterium]|nr:16S rRNA (cytidine(1402)-2'-O)-methyltransferase [Oscillospiraceae bacterium]